MVTYYIIRTEPFHIEQAAFLTQLTVNFEPKLSLIITLIIILVHSPPYLIDLNPYEFYLWCHMKDFIYEKLADFITPQKFTIDLFSRIRREPLEFETANFVTRLRYCITPKSFQFWKLYSLNSFSTFFSIKIPLIYMQRFKITSVQSCRLVKIHLLYI